MTATDVEVVDVTELDFEFAPPCEYINMFRWRMGAGPCGKPAELIVRVGSLSCGCKIPARFFCRPCFIERQTQNGVGVICVVCSVTDWGADTREILISVEPIHA